MAYWLKLYYYIAIVYVLLFMHRASKMSPTRVAKGLV